MACIAFMKLPTEEERLEEEVRTAAELGVTVEELREMRHQMHLNYLVMDVMDS